MPEQAPVQRQQLAARLPRIKPSLLKRDADALAGAIRILGRLVGEGAKGIVLSSIIVLLALPFGIEIASGVPRLRPAGRAERPCGGSGTPASCS